MMRFPEKKCVHNQITVWNSIYTSFQWIVSGHLGADGVDVPKPVDETKIEFIFISLMSVSILLIATALLVPALHSLTSSHQSCSCWTGKRSQWQNICGDEEGARDEGRRSQSSLEHEDINDKAIVVQQILIPMKTNLQLVIPMLYLLPRLKLKKSSNQVLLNQRLPNHWPKLNNQMR